MNTTDLIVDKLTRDGYEVERRPVGEMDSSAGEYFLVDCDELCSFHVSKDGRVADVIFRNTYIISICTLSVDHEFRKTVTELVMEAAVWRGE